MISGIGIDLVSIPRTRAMMERWGKRFLAKVFTEAEIEAGLSRPRPEEEFAAWFGAKEAVMKALGRGILGGIRFKDIEVRSDARTRPRIELHGGAGRAARSAGVKDIHLSLTHEVGPDGSGGYAAASVVLVRGGSRER